MQQSSYRIDICVMQCKHVVQAVQPRHVWLNHLYVKSCHSNFYHQSPKSAHPKLTFKLTVAMCSAGCSKCGYTAPWAPTTCNCLSNYCDYAYYSKTDTRCWGLPGYNNAPPPPPPKQVTPELFNKCAGCIRFINNLMHIYPSCSLWTKYHQFSFENSLSI